MGLAARGRCCLRDCASDRSSRRCLGKAPGGSRRDGEAPGGMGTWARGSLGWVDERSCAPVLVPNVRTGRLGYTRGVLLPRHSTPGMFPSCLLLAGNPGEAVGWLWLRAGSPVPDTRPVLPHRSCWGFG